MEQMQALWDKATAPCEHPKFNRYGNRHGRYSQCLQCEKKWQWNEDLQKWVEPAPSRKQQQPLPLPSSSTAAHFKDKRYQPKFYQEHAADPPCLPLDSMPEPKSSLKPSRASRTRSASVKRSQEENQVVFVEDEEMEDFDWALVQDVPNQG